MDEQDINHYILEYHRHRVSMYLARAGIMVEPWERGGLRICGGGLHMGPRASAAAA